MIRTQVQLTEAQVRRLRELAAERGASMAELVREAVDQMLLFQPSISHEDRWRRALAASGQFASGRTDISVRHDDYLEEHHDPRGSDVR